MTMTFWLAGAVCMTDSSESDVEHLWEEIQRQFNIRCPVPATAADVAVIVAVRILCPPGVCQQPQPLLFITELRCRGEGTECHQEKKQNNHIFKILIMREANKRPV